jgi:hypothetical protein
MPDNQPKPAQHAAASAPAKAPIVTHYKALHAVGVWEAGAIIPAADLAQPGIDIDRLLSLGAIAVTAAPDE